MWSWFWRQAERPDDVVRDWLSEAEWQEAVDRIRKRPMNLNGEERRDDRAPRHETIRRCLLRVERPRKGVLGMLVVRTRNVSATGMCVVHGGHVPKRATATIVIEVADGSGLVTTGKIVWCRRIKELSTGAHEIGIHFDQPIDVSPFIGGSSDAPGLAA